MAKWLQHGRLAVYVAYNLIIFLLTGGIMALDLQ
jgi:hypothetical protein